MDTRHNLHYCAKVAVVLACEADFRLPIAEGANDIHFPLCAVVPAEVHRHSTFELG
jgi:hypothetical protein